MDELRIGFLIGSRSRFRAWGLTAKHARMRLEGLVYPDVYSLPYFLAPGFRFIRDGTRVPPERYDLVFSELNRSDAQLDDLVELATSGVPLAIVPGPPEFWQEELTGRKRERVRFVLERAKHVLAYAEPTRSFADELLGSARAVRIPWPFDHAAVRRVAGERRPPGQGTVRILLDAPLLFTGPTQNYPHLRREAMLRVLAELPASIRKRVSLHTFVYRAEDRSEFARSGFDRGLPLRLEHKRGFRSFLRFLASCDAVVNFTRGSVLGRITFLAAALDRPGLFSDNAELNRALYPDATLPILDVEGLRTSLSRLIESVADGRPEPDFLPAPAAVAAVGDYAANASRFRALLGIGDAGRRPERVGGQ